MLGASLAASLVAIGGDKHIRTCPAETAQTRDASLRVLRIGGKRDPPTWSWLVRIIKRWEDVETLLRGRPAGPWFYRQFSPGLGITRPPLLLEVARHADARVDVRAAL